MSFLRAEAEGVLCPLVLTWCGGASEGGFGFQAVASWVMARPVMEPVCGRHPTNLRPSQSFLRGRQSHGLFAKTSHFKSRKKHFISLFHSVGVTLLSVGGTASKATLT